MNILESSTCLIPIVQCLKDYQNVKRCCFSSKLQPGFKEAIKNLKSLFLSAQEIAVKLDKKINATWKVHILLCHVQPYVEHHNQGLSNFAKQVEESINESLNQHGQGLRDRKFKPTWSRNKEHPYYGERLLSAVVDFGAKGI